MEKKGSVTDLPFIMIGIFTLTVIVLCVSLVGYHLNENIQQTNIFESDVKQVTEDMSTGYMETMNVFIIIIFFLLCIVSLILASLISIHPAWIFFYILEWIILIWLGGGIANVYQVIIESDPMGVIAPNYVAATFFFRYFPLFITLIGAILAIVMYKTKSTIWGDNY